MRYSAFIYRAVGAAIVLMCATALSGAFASKLVKQWPLDATTIPQFVQDLPDFSALGRVDGDVAYRVRSEEFQQRILPAAFYAKLRRPYSAGTMLFGYGIDQGTKHYPSLPTKGLYPGYTVVVTRDHAAAVDYRNHLHRDALERLLTGDQSIHWANPLAAHMMVGARGNPAPYLGPMAGVTHLHGAEDPSAFDGGPEEWWTPGAEGTRAIPPRHGTRGPGFVNNVYHYPNAQEPTTLWFHDHTLGTTRENVVGGLAAFYLIRGNGDDGMPGSGKLPAGRQEVELVFQDRQFDTNGQLLFPDGYPSGLDGPLQDAKTHPYWMPEFFGDVIVVNGKSWPRLSVAPKRYRFRLLDWANTRFFNLQLCVNPTGGVTRAAHSACLGSEGNVPFHVIGNDGGLLNAPVRVDHLLFSPGERYDAIVDFARFRGRTITVRNDAVTPYPSAFAKFTPRLQGRIMRFIVGRAGGVDDSYDPKAGGPLRGPGSTVAPNLAKMVRLPGTVGGLPLRSPIADGTRVQLYRQVTLNPVFTSGRCHWPGTSEADGIEEMLLNNSTWTGLREGSTVAIPGSKRIAGNWETELPELGSSEVWDIIDLSNDDHPIHLHLVQFQVIARIPFDLARFGAAYYAVFPHGRCIPGYGPPKAYATPNAAGAVGGNPDVTKFFLRKGQPYCKDDGVYDGTGGPARPEERGWKDTVIASCGHVTRVVVRFTPQDLPAIRDGQPIAYSGRNEYPFDPTDSDPLHVGKGDYPGGPGYVWHCHLIDHEDNEMMRPMIPVNTPGR
jgi:FtsP/CotA-like multicopper oxidase with cupredoxin domain